MVVLSREVFDAIEFDAACSGDHRAAALQMSRLADMGIQTPAMARSEAYVRAGEQWLLADDPAAAANRFQRALEDGGPASVDPRAPLARALFMLGRTWEAEALVRQLEKERPRDARMCDLLAELFVERSDLPRALAWATVGVELCLGRAPEPVSRGQAAAGLSAVGREGAEPGREGDPSAQAGRESDPSAQAGRESDGKTDPGREPPERMDSVPRALRDRTELRLLLTLRYRIRNDLGLPEDSYDRLLDQLPPGFADPAGAEAG